MHESEQLNNQLKESLSLLWATSRLRPMVF